MVNNKNTASSVPLSVFIVFLVFKLTGEINWSWWWVTSPLWISLFVVILIMIIAGIIALLIKK